MHNYAQLCTTMYINAQLYTTVSLFDQLYYQDVEALKISNF